MTLVGYKNIIFWEKETIKIWEKICENICEREEGVSFKVLFKDFA